MKGLLLKDWLVIVKQTKVYFLLMFLFALVPGMGIYSIFFGALLPMTALAYDERSKWGQMAKMMPYSNHKMVAEKYLFGYLLAGDCRFGGRDPNPVFHFGNRRGRAFTKYGGYYNFCFGGGECYGAAAAGNFSHGGGKIKDFPDVCHHQRYVWPPVIFFCQSF